MLGEVMGLQSEVSVLKIYSGTPDFLSSIRLFGEKGFDISGMLALARDRCLRIVEFDCVMINRKATESAS